MHSKTSSSFHDGSRSFPVWFQKPLIQAVALIALVFVAYFPVFDAGFIWDDDAHITNNEELRTVGGLKQIWIDRHATPQYYPLVHTMFWLEYQLWGPNPRAFHINNVWLHGLNGVLCWLLLRRLVPRGAWLIAAVFAVHPVQVESVAWVTERKNVLSGFFYLAAAIAYLKFQPVCEEGRSSPNRWWYYGASLVLFSCALLSKSVTASLPAAILVVIWWKRGRLCLKDILPLLPLFGIGILAGMSTAELERTSVGAIGPEWEFSFAQRCLIAGRAAWFYAAKLLWPNPLAFNYPRWDIDTTRLWQYLFPLTAVILIGGFYALRRKIGRGPLAAILIFGGTLFPALGFVNVYPMRYSFVADHFQYLASISMISLFISGLFLLKRKLLPTFVSPSVAVVALCVLAALTARQCMIYKNEETLWHDTLAKNPNSGLAYANLGNLYTRRGEHQRAVGMYLEALKANPTDKESLHLLANNLHDIGRIHDAIQYLRKLVQFHPQDARGHAALALMLVEDKQFDDAISHFEQAISTEPNEPVLHLELANALVAVGRLEDSLAHCEKARRLDPNYDDAKIAIETVKQLLEDRKRNGAGR